MTSVTDLDLPDFDFEDPGLVGEAYHQSLAALRQRSWLARSPIALLVLDRAAAEFFLRDRATVFPGRQIAELFGITAGPLFEHIDANVLNLSGETHRRLRSIVARAFTPVAANKWRPVMRQILDQLWHGLEDEGRIDSVAGLAKPYPALTIAAILGASPDDAPRLHYWSTWVQRQFDIRALSTDLPRIEAAVIELNDYV
ncbi:MAG TPA: hypothetical protein VFV02_16235, partial [Acidimicrobiales bacterium]|nr:hypothetical protein [Acidimicrobiales bacterium]